MSINCLWLLKILGLLWNVYGNLFTRKFNSLGLSGLLIIQVSGIGNKSKFKKERNNKVF